MFSVYRHSPAALLVCDVDDLIEAVDSDVPGLARAVAAFDSAGVPIVLWSSASAAELLPFREVVGLRHPFFVENGSALFIPERYFRSVPLVAMTQGAFRIIEFGCGRTKAAAFLLDLARRHGVTATCADAAPGTALRTVVGAARCAAPRVYDQPFTLQGADTITRQRLWRGLRRAGLSWTQSCHCEHVNGVLDPGVGLAMLRTLFEAEQDGPIVMLGVGRAEHHLPLLREADVALVARMSNTGVLARLRRHVPSSTVLAVRARWRELLERAHFFAAAETPAH